MKEGGHLASIHSLAEMVLVTDLIKNHIHPLWLGLANMQDGEGVTVLLPLVVSVVDISS